MNIFESLENLPISEGCFNEIMDIVESLVTEIKKKYPHPAVIKDEKSADYESAVKTLPHREKLLSKALELRRKANSPFSSKYASKNDNGEEQTRNRSAEVLFLKDKVSESLYDEIMGLVEGILSEENLINKRDQYHISKKSTADTEAELKSNPLLHSQSLERMRFGYNNGKDDSKDVAKYRIGMHDGAKHQVHAYKPEYRCDSDTTPCDRAEETKNRIKRAHGASSDDEEGDW